MQGHGRRKREPEAEVRHELGERTERRRRKASAGKGRGVTGEVLGGRGVREVPRRHGKGRILSRGNHEAAEQ